jgi:hypothetical protein
MASEFEKYRRKAIKYGWTMPANDAFGPNVWLRYWQDMDQCRKDPSGGRPVAPHRSGGGQVFR